MINRLLDRIGSPEDIYNAQTSAYYKIKDMDPNVVERLEDKSMDETDKCIAFCKKYGVRILTKGDDGYPERLLYIDKPPMLLYVMGDNIDIDDNVCVAIVGTRHCTEYGRNVSAKLGYEIAKQGGIVVSGIAQGIDGAAHAGCLEAGGKTIAVLGCGLSVAYPPCNRDLYKAVVKSGMLVTEYPPYSRPEKTHFPIRNRLISGLCQAAVIVESNVRSGALITARYARRQGRLLFAVPAKITDFSGSGNLELIKSGAKIVTCGADVLEEFELSYPDKIKIDRKMTAPLPVDTAHPEQERKTKTAKKEDALPEKREKATLDDVIGCERLDDVGRKLVVSLLDGPKNADELVRESGLMIDEVMISLTYLEISETVTALPGGVYKLNFKK